jgi:hypothetical protein
MKIKDLFEEGTAGGTTSAMVPTVPGGRQSTGKGKKVKANLLGFVVPESNKKEPKIIKRTM